MYTIRNVCTSDKLPTNYIRLLVLVLTFELCVDFLLRANFTYSTVRIHLHVSCVTSSCSDLVVGAITKTLRLSLILRYINSGGGRIQVKGFMINWLFNYWADRRILNMIGIKLCSQGSLEMLVMNICI